MIVLYRLLEDPTLANGTNYEVEFVFQSINQLDHLLDVIIDEPISNNQVLTYDTSLTAWTNSTPSTARLGVAIAETSYPASTTQAFIGPLQWREISATANFVNNNSRFVTNPIWDNTINSRLRYAGDLVPMIFILDLFFIAQTDILDNFNCQIVWDLSSSQDIFTLPMIFTATGTNQTFTYHKTINLTTTVTGGPSLYVQMQNVTYPLTPTLTFAEFRLSVHTESIFALS